MKPVEPAAASGGVYVDVERIKFEIADMKGEAADVAAMQSRLEEMMATGKVDTSALAAVDKRIEHLRLRSQSLTYTIDQIISSLQKS